MSAAEGKNKSKPILSAAFALFEKVAPGSLLESERAWRELVPQLRFLVIAKTERPTITQLEAIRSLNKEVSLVQVRKAIQAGELRYGPFPGHLAKRHMVPQLVKHGLSVSLRQLSHEEKAQQLQGRDDLPPYFRSADYPVDTR